jgi:hypothetical protein
MLNKIKSVFSKSNILILLSTLLIVFSCLVLYTSYFFPIYPDEIQNRIGLSRFFYDYPLRANAAAACISNLYHTYSFSALIPATLEFILHGKIESPHAMRVVGFVLLFSWLIPLFYYFYIQIKTPLINFIFANENKYNQYHVLVFVLSFFIIIFSIGVVPIFLVTNRNEQLIFLSIIPLFLIFFASKNIKESSIAWIKKAVLLLIYMVAISLCLYSHPKSLFLLPFLIIITWATFKNFDRKYILFFALSYLFSNAYQEFLFYKSVFLCPENIAFENMLKSFSIDPLSIFYKPFSFFKDLYYSLLNSPQYINKIIFRNLTDIGYLPAIKTNILTKFTNLFICLSIIGVFTFLSINLIKKIIGKKTTLINFILFIFFACVIISALFNTQKNWYDAGYIYVMLCITLIFFIGENKEVLPSNLSLKRFFIFFAVLSLFSQAIFISRYLPQFLKGFKGPGVAILNHESNKIRQDIDLLAQDCDISLISAKNLIVDDFTYFYLTKNKFPVPITYLYFSSGSDENILRNFFSKINPDGLIARCGIPNESFSKNRNGLCCISKANLLNIYK